MSEKIVTIFGTSRTAPGEEVFDLAYELGRLCAQTGFTIANGGYAGTMLAAAKGAKQAGGKTIGVTCRAFNRGGPNEFVSEEIETANLTERVEKLIIIGDGYVVLPGGTGTLLELADIWERTNKGFINPPKPIILLTGFFRPLVDIIATEDERSSNFITIAATAKETVEILKEKI
ncbi:MAG: LOG family protein [Sedimentisphaerales bacterium]|nr:LOG family protein [Sedimentisphaerales bacterium]